MTSFALVVTHILSFGTLAMGVLVLFLIILAAGLLKSVSWSARVKVFFEENAVLFSFIVALGASMGSLFYSDVVGFEPCFLCWWHRIFMYPQVVILAIAFFKKRADVRVYSLALSAFGLLVSLYHTLIQFGGTSVIPCPANGASCTVLYFLEYGYITIPTMSLTTFALIFVLMYMDNSEKQGTGPLFQNNSNG